MNTVGWLALTSAAGSGLFSKLWAPFGYRLIFWLRIFRGSTMGPEYWELPFWLWASHFRSYDRSIRHSKQLRYLWIKTGCLATTAHNIQDVCCSWHGPAPHVRRNIWKSHTPKIQEKVFRPESPGPFLSKLTF